MLVPVTNAASGEQRNDTRPATSVGVPRRPRGVARAQVASVSGRASGVAGVGGDGDVAGRDEHDADAVGGEVEGETAGEAEQSGLRRGVGDGVALGGEGGDRADVDDHAAAALAHRGRGGARAAERRAEVDREHVVEALVGALVEGHQRRRSGDGGVVDQHVDAAELGHAVGDEPPAGVAVGEVVALLGGGRRHAEPSARSRATIAAPIPPSPPVTMATRRSRHRSVSPAGCSGRTVTSGPSMTMPSPAATSAWRRSIITVAGRGRDDALDDVGVGVDDLGDQVAFGDRVAGGDGGDAPSVRRRGERGVDVAVAADHPPAGRSVAALGGRGCRSRRARRATPST